MKIAHLLNDHTALGRSKSNSGCEPCKNGLAAGLAVCHNVTAVAEAATSLLCFFSGRVIHMSGSVADLGKIILKINLRSDQDHRLKIRSRPFFLKKNS
jgi:hypothetical protein